MGCSGYTSFSFKFSNHYQTSHLHDFLRIMTLYSSFSNDFRRRNSHLSFSCSFLFFASGRLYPDHDLQGMLQEATGPLNFTQFLAIIGDKIMGQDKEDVIKAAFKTFDTNDTGKVSAKVLKKALMTWGEKLSDAEIEAALADAPIDSKGNVDILQYVKTISGSKEELD